MACNKSVTRYNFYHEKMVNYNTYLCVIVKSRRCYVVFRGLISSIHSSGHSKSEMLCASMSKINKKKTHVICVMNRLCMLSAITAAAATAATAATAYLLCDKIA